MARILGSTPNFPRAKKSAKTRLMQPPHYVPCWRGQSLVEEFFRWFRRPTSDCSATMLDIHTLRYTATHRISEPKLLVTPIEKAALCPAFRAVVPRTH